MPATITNPVVLLKEDYEVLTHYFKSGRPPVMVQEKQTTKTLQDELDRAVVLTEEEFPGDIIRLNSVAVIKDLHSNRVIAVTLVMPQLADIRKNKISVLAPLGTALIGFKRGQTVTWQLPGGVKSFLIMEVYNSSGKKS